jgi:membrane protein insertase Oxa1/YidC/SpoIIIJ
MTTLEQVTSSILPPSIAAFTTKLSFWGMTGLLLTNFHTTLQLPYWACISLTNVLVRSAMIPIVIHGAKTQVKLGSVSPEVQYLLTSFTTDMTTLGKAAGQGKVGQKNSDYYVNQLYKGRIILIKATMETLRGIYRMKDINPLAIFKVRDGNK